MFVAHTQRNNRYIIILADIVAYGEKRTYAYLCKTAPPNCHVKYFCLPEQDS